MITDFMDEIWGQEYKIFSLKGHTALSQKFYPRDERSSWYLVTGGFFDSIFYSNACECTNECLKAVAPKVTLEMSKVLLWRYDVDEIMIKATLFQMGPTKAPNPNGMNILFFQKFWLIVGDNVAFVVLSFLNFGILEDDINYMNTVLIPKVKAPEKIMNYRPISLCNVIQKIIAKVLAN